MTMLSDSATARRLWPGQFEAPAWAKAPAWVCVESEHRRERTAVKSLEDAGLEAYCPFYLCKVKVRKRIATVKRPLFPGYLFTRLIVSSYDWSEASHAKGVRRVIVAGDWPGRVPDQVIEKIRGAVNCGIAEETPDLPFAPGQTVRVEDGPFAGFEALVESIRAGKVDEEAAVHCLLSIFGRQTPAEFSADQLGRI